MRLQRWFLRGEGGGGTGKLGDNLSPKGERWLGRLGLGKIQLCSTWKMALELISSPWRIVGASFGLQIWKLEEFG